MSFPSELPYAVNKFIAYGAALVAATNSGVQEQVETENALQVVMSKLTRAKVSAVKEILGRPEYDPDKGIKNLGPNESAQKQEMERLLDELDLESDYKRLSAEEVQLELKLSLLKMKSKQIAIALRMWEQFNGLLEALLARPDFADQIGTGVLLGVGKGMARVGADLVEPEQG